MEESITPTAVPTPVAVVESIGSEAAQDARCRVCGVVKPIGLYSPSERRLRGPRCRQCTTERRLRSYRRRRLSRDGLYAGVADGRRLVAVLSDRPHLLDDAEAEYGIDATRAIVRTALKAAAEIEAEAAEIARLQAELDGALETTQTR